MAGTGRGIGRIIKAFGYSMQGLRAGWRHEPAFRQATLLCATLFPCTFWLGRGPLDYAVLIASLVFVLVTELFNSAIEALTDRVGTEHHELSGRAKDLSSAAVLLALLLLAMIWGAVAWVRFAPP